MSFIINLSDLSHLCPPPQPHTKSYAPGKPCYGIQEAILVLDIFDFFFFPCSISFSFFIYTST